MIITSRERSRDGSMIRVFLDDKYAFSIPEEAYVTHHLYDREELSDEELEAIRQDILVKLAREKAVRLLTAKDRTENELVERLCFNGFDKDIACEAIRQLKIIGYVDDSRYVLKYATERVRNKALSRKALRYELEHKGVDSTLIHEVLGEFEINDDEIALRAAKKKFGKYDVKTREMEVKVLSFLTHRGFSLETSRNALKKLKGKE